VGDELAIADHLAGWGLYVSTRFLLGYPIAAGPLDRAPWLVLSGLAVLSAVVRGHVGDAAVYLSPSPANIEARQKIRAAGLELLENVRASGRYDRIIIVGHSLGSVIGYDVLTLAWQRHVDEVRKSQTDRWAKDDKFQINTSAIVLAEALAREIRGGAGSDGEAAAARWREATRAVAVEQEANGSRWMVTDFITLGSPLAHGDLLLARNRLDFERRAREHELPNCPPVIEGKGVFSFEHEGRDSRGRQEALVLNHAALFAATVWTNLYFPCRAILWGDVVGGPVAPVFSGGVRDILVRTARRRGWLAHTLYWNWDDRDREFATSPVQQLRLAMDLPRREMKAPAKDSSDKAAKAGLEESTAAIPLP